MMEFHPPFDATEYEPTDDLHGEEKRLQTARNWFLAFYRGEETPDTREEAMYEFARLIRQKQYAQALELMEPYSTPRRGVVGGGRR